MSTPEHSRLVAGVEHDLVRNLSRLEDLDAVAKSRPVRRVLREAFDALTEARPSRGETRERRSDTGVNRRLGRARSRNNPATGTRDDRERDRDL